MPVSEAREKAKRKGFCVVCCSPRDSRIPEYGQRCQVCYMKHLSQKSAAARARRGQEVQSGGYRIQ